jgi:hypothetical protein
MDIMKINCACCDTPTKIHNNSIVKMRCLCDEDHRMLCLDKIKNGSYKDLVYLFEDGQKYDEKEPIFCFIE